MTQQQIEGKDPIRVSVSVMTGLDALRESGECNMFDIFCAMAWLAANSHMDAASWVAANQENYMQGIFVGFITSDD